MKLSKKILSAFLTALIVCSSLCIPAFAADAQTDTYAKLREGTGYVAIGDSFTRGYGAGTNWQNEIYKNDTETDPLCRNVGGSYPNLVAEALGLNAPDDIRDKSATMWSLAHDAVSTAYMLDLLGIDDGYRDEEFLYARGYMKERYATDLKYFGDPASYALDGTPYGKTGDVMSVRELLKNASLISVQVGQSDIVYKAQIFGFNELNLGDPSTLPAGIANIIKLLYNYFEYWKGAYPLLLDYIKEINPDAKVVLIGTMNPIANATLTDEISIKIGSVLNIIFDLMNTYAKKCALERGFMFVDISDVETPSAASKISIGSILSLTDDIEFGLQAHPTAKGYKQIADKIVDTVTADLEMDAIRDNFSFFGFFDAFFKVLRAFLANFIF